MAIVTKNRAARQPVFSSDSGNSWVQDYPFEVNATGIMVDSDQKSPVASGDVVRLGLLQAGLKVFDVHVITSDANTALATADVGFEYVDGVDDADYPEGAQKFVSDANIAAVAKIRSNSGNRPTILKKDAYLTLTVGGASLAEAGVVDVIVNAIWIGVPTE